MLAVRSVSQRILAWSLRLCRVLAFCSLAGAAIAQTPAAPPSQVSSCETELPGARLGPPSHYVVQLDSDTLWRPRGAEVRFTVSGTSGSAATITQVQACFRWRSADETSAPATVPFLTSPLVRGVPNTAGLVEYGAIVPDLAYTDIIGTTDGKSHSVAALAIGTVPVADMQVLIELSDGHRIAVVLPVGITSAQKALLILGFFLLVAGIILWRSAPSPLLVNCPRRSLASVSRHLLAVISSSNGVASLSQFQIMLWTLVVGGSAIYVMALSGNLLSISSGTLVLLGIASGTTVLARVPSKTTPPVDPAAPMVVGIPKWSQMLIDDPATPQIDVTRVQMLIFTLVSAAFVVIKVAVSYSIPDIPDNFLVLMGISNGVYLAGRQLPDTPKGTAKAGP